MGILKGALKITESAILVTTGIASTITRNAFSAANIDALADLSGRIQDASFETIRDIWTSEEKKDELYYIERENRSIAREKSARIYGEQERRKYEKLKKEYERK